MEAEFFAIEGIVNDDLAYRGSRFAEVRDAISGNYCRCTGYHAIVDAVLQAARRLA